MEIQIERPLFPMPVAKLSSLSFADSCDLRAVSRAPTDQFLSRSCTRCVTRAAPIFSATDAKEAVAPRQRSFPHRKKSVEVAKKLVGAVDQVNDHSCQKSFGGNFARPPSLVHLLATKFTKQSNFLLLLFAITLAHRTVKFETIRNTLGIPRKTRKGICWLFPCLPCFPWSRSESRILRKSLCPWLLRSEVARY